MSSITRVSYTADAADVISPVFSFSSIDLLPVGIATAEQQIDVYLLRVGETVQELLTVTTEYTINSSTKDVTLDGSVGLAVGDVVTIDRDTQLASRYIDFTGVSYLNSDASNNNSDQLLHLIQELATSVANALIKTPDEGYWEGENLELLRLAPATNGSSAPTLAQVQNLLAGTDTAELGDTHYFTATTAGSATKYILTDFPKGDTSDEKIFVTLDGVVQTPTTSYTYAYDPADGDPALTWVAAPDDGLSLEVRTTTGLVQAVIANDSIDGEALIDGSVDETKLGFGAGSAKRFIRIDATGDASLVQPDHDDITDFDSAVEAKRLDQFAPPTTDLAVGSNKVTGLTSGTASTDAVNKGQLDSEISGVVASAVAAAEAAVAFEITQSYTTVTNNTALTNSASKPIHVSYVRSSGGASICRGQVEISSTFRDVSYIPSSGDGYVSFWVPAGVRYKVIDPSAGGSLNVVISEVQ